MIFNIPLITDMKLIWGYQCREVIIDKCLRRANFHRRSCDYKVGDEILILLDKPSTLDDCGRGPYSNIQVYANGIPVVTFNEPCTLQNELIFIASNLFKGKTFSLGVGE